MFYPRINEQMHKHFPTAPPLEQLLYNKTALILLNSHPSISEPRPHVPNMIEIGGFHVDEPKALPKVSKYLPVTTKILTNNSNICLYMYGNDAILFTECL